MTTHNHEHCCEHEEVRYCKVCGVAYCKKCGKEWREYGWTYTYPPYTAWIAGSENYKISDSSESVQCNHI